MTEYFFLTEKNVHLKQAFLYDYDILKKEKKSINLIKLNSFLGGYFCVCVKS